jgi:hypothetical protein
VSKRTAKYPKDEFDQVDPRGLPAGVHRAPATTWSKVSPYVIVVVICAVLAVGVVYALSRNADSPLNSLVSPTVSVTPTDEATTDDGTPAVDPSTEPAPVETTVEPPTDPTTDAPVDVDTSVQVRVLNATGRAGVAGAAAEKLTQAGWTNTEAADYTGDPIDESAVFYKTAENEAQAREVARILGITGVFPVEDYRAPVTVVLSGSFGQ